MLSCTHPALYRISLVEPLYHRLLLIEYVAETGSGHSAVKAIERKDKRPLPIPVNFALSLLPITLKYFGSFVAGDTVRQRLTLCSMLPYTLLTCSSLIRHTSCTPSRYDRPYHPSRQHHLNFDCSGLSYNTWSFGQVISFNLFLEKMLSSHKAASIAGIICEALNVLCNSGPYSVHFADVYLEVIDFISIRYFSIFSPNTYYLNIS